MIEIPKYIDGVFGYFKNQGDLVLQEMKTKSLAPVAWCLVAIIAPIVLQGGLRIWSPAPLWIGGDHAFFLSDLKQMVMRQSYWSSAITGYPFGQVNAYFPTFEPLFRVVLFVIARLGFDVFTATKIFYVLGIGAMGGAAYACLRFLDVRRFLACAGAIVFVVSPYFQIRALNHDMLSIYVSAAFGAAFALKIACMEKQDEFFHLIRRPVFIIGMITIATCGLYYAMFSLLLMGVATLALTMKTMQWRALVVFGGISVAVLVALLTLGLGPQLSIFLHGAPKRLPVEQFWHGLSISDAMYAFDWIPRVHEHILHYETTRPSTLVGEGAHEWPGPILTIAIIASPLALFLGRASDDPRWRSIVAASALMGFILIFAGRAGIGYLLNELINPSLRAQARIMPLLMFLAIFVVMTGAQYAWSTTRPVFQIVAVLAVAVTLGAAWTVGGVLSQRQLFTANNIDIQWQIATFKRLEVTKDAAGLKAVLQLPVTSWPEAPFRNGFDFYPMRYGFVFDRPDSQTKWSYGVSAQQPGFAKLDTAFKAYAEPAGIVERARGFGFDSILVEKRPYSPEELKVVLDDIQASVPATCLIFDDGQRVVYDIGAQPACRAAIK